MDIAQSIVRTLAFFDLFEHPLTNFELHKWLYTAKPVDFSVILAEACHLKPQIQEQSFPKRQERVMANDQKFRLAQKAARLISWAPFVRLVAVCNTLSFGAAEEGSDIDFFIIAKKGRIWTVRFFVTVILSFFCLRRHGRKITNRVCLSFFITDDNLDLQSIALPSLRHSDPDVASGEESLPDIYLIYWITQLIPLINRDETLEKFWQANHWVKNYLANFSFESQLPDYHQIKIPAWVEGWRQIHEKLTAGSIGDWREGALRWLQLKKIAKKKEAKARTPIIHSNGVVINDQMLKFHEEDRREEYREKWERA